MKITKLALATVLALTAATSCSKDDNNTQEVETAPAYLPSVRYQGTTPLDSFSYNSNNQLDRLYVANDEGVYSEYFQFSYNTAGQCNAVRNYIIGSTKLPTLDTLVYSTGKVTDYYYNPNNGGSIDLTDGTEYKLTSDGIVQEGSKDTVISGTDKIVNYSEYTYTGNNLVSTNFHGYFVTADGTVREDQDSKATFTTDSKDNGYYWIFKSNPYAYFVYINNANTEMVMPSPGKNNYTKIERTYSAPGNSISSVINYTNTYDPVSGYLLTTQPEYLGEQYPAYSFSYVKSK